MQTVTLNGQWQVKQATQADEAWLAATVPGCVHTDLLAAAAIPDPFYRDNEHQVMWIGEVDWVYRRTFTVAADLLQHERVLLQCAGTGHPGDPLAQRNPTRPDRQHVPHLGI